MSADQELIINDRIHELMSDLGSNPSAFADSLGVNPTVIFNIVKGRRSKPSFDLLQKILITYSAINANWLLKGEGDKWQNASEKSYESLEQRIQSVLNRLAQELQNSPELEELTELVKVLLNENKQQKVKIEKLYDKQDQILQVLRDKLAIQI